MAVPHISSSGSIALAQASFTAAVPQAKVRKINVYDYE